MFYIPDKSRAEYMDLVKTSEPCEMPVQSHSGFYAGDYIGSHLRNRPSTFKPSDYDVLPGSTYCCYYLEENTIPCPNQDLEQLLYYSCDSSVSGECIESLENVSTEIRKVLDRLNEKIDYNREICKSSRALRYNKVAYFVINVKAIIDDEDDRRTCRVDNIPREVSALSFGTGVDREFEGEYDYLYLVMDDRDSSYNLGYAYINFTSVYSLIRFYSLHHNKKWIKRCEMGPLRITYAEVQH